MRIGLATDIEDCAPEILNDLYHAAIAIRTGNGHLRVRTHGHEFAVPHDCRIAACSGHDLLTGFEGCAAICIACTVGCAKYDLPLHFGYGPGSGLGPNAGARKQEGKGDESA